MNNKLFIGLLYAFTLPSAIILAVYSLYLMGKGKLTRSEVESFVYSNMDGVFVFSTLFWLTLFLI